MLYKIVTKKPTKMALLLGIMLNAFFAIQASAATNLQVAQYPLEIGLEPFANVLLLADDSKSMDWEIVYNERISGSVPDNSLPHLDNYFYGYLYSFGNYSGHPTDKKDGHIVPTVEWLTTNYATHKQYARLSQLWKMRNHQYNKIYYNPAVTYVPWEGYPASDPAAAKIDPADSSSATVNLVASNTLLTFTIPKNTTSTLSVDDSSDIIRNDARERIAMYYTQNPLTSVVTRTDITDATSAEAKNFANWFTYYRRRLYTAQTAMSEVVGNVTGLNFGYSTINDTHQVPVGRNTNAAVVAKIFSTQADGKTPLRAALYKAGRYFQCSSDSLMTGCPIPAQGSGGECQQNFTILMTDGFWDDSNDDFYQGSPSSSVQSFQDINHDGNTSSAFDGGAFADSQTKTLADIAMYFYKTDLATGITNSVPGLDVDKDRMVTSKKASYWTAGKKMHQHMKTYTVGFGVLADVAAFPAPSASSPWPTVVSGRDPSKIDDLMHTAYNGRGEYYSAENAQDLSNKLKNALVSIRDATGGANAVSFNTQKVENNTVVYTAGYDSKYNSGDVSAFLYNNGTLSATPSWTASAQLATQVSAARPAACNGDGTQSDGRTILTYYRDRQVSGALAPVGAPFTSPLPGALASVLSQREINWLRGHNYTEASCSGGTLRTRANNRLIGDIAHSRPLYIGDPSMRNRTEEPFPTGTDSYALFKAKYASGGTRDSYRDPMVLVGANDGLFHSFFATGNNAGSEMFAYVPSMLIHDTISLNNSVKTLMDPKYSHRFFVDLPPAVNDVFIDKTPSTAGGEEWATVAIGGLRGGGRGYFALDVTETSVFATEASGKNQVMWEFSNADNGDLGLTYSPPMIVMSNLKKANGKNRWFAIFGNGYNSDSGKAQLFVLDIEKGYDGWVATDYYVFSPTDGAPGATKNGLGIPRAVDFDENGTADYVYAGDLKGNLYRFDLSSGVAADYDSAAKLTARSVKIFTAATNQPITTQPVVVRHPVNAESIIVTVTTGSWFQEDDAVSISANQSIYGVWDRLQATPTVATRSNMLERTLVNVVEPPSTTVYRVFASSAAISWYTSGTASPTNALGWYIDFDIPAVGAAANTTQYPGEKAIRDMVMRDGYIFVNTVIPVSSRACNISLKGTMLAFNPKTGSLAHSIFGQQANSKPVAGMQLDGLPSSSTILESSPNPYVITEMTDASGNKTLLSNSINTGVTTRSGRLAWRQIE